MGLTATVILPRGRYDAGTEDARVSEVVPSPYRLFCALVASAARTMESPLDSEALKWLEAQEPPLIDVPTLLATGRDDNYFVINRTWAKGGSMTHPGRKNVAKHRAWTTFNGPGFKFHWNATPSEQVLRELNGIARGVTYLGRVESTAVVDFCLADDTAAEGCLRPVELSVPGSDVATPFAGATEALVAAHERGDRAWETTRKIRYAMATPTTTVPTSPFEQMLVFRIEGQPVDASHMLELALAFRAAVMGRVKDVVGSDNLPTQVHGHRKDIDHVAFVALPFVGHAHADGAVRGLATLLPDSLSTEDLAVIGAALTDSDDPFTSVSFGKARGGKLPITYEPYSTRPWLLQPQRWRGRMTGTTVWHSATPMMMDRYPKKPAQTPAVVADAVQAAGFPRPADVTVSTTPTVVGATTWRRSWAGHLGKRQLRPVVHASIRFDEPVEGPLLVGALRYLGFGLFIPMDASSGAPPSSKPTSDLTVSGKAHDDSDS